MSDEAIRRTKAWVETWLKVGPELEAIRDRELHDMTHEERIRAIDALLQIGSQFGKARDTSGLVEQQRLFQKARLQKAR